MFKRILIATDGSPLSRSAIATGVDLARTVKASVVGIHARPPMMPISGEGAVMVSRQLEAAHRERTMADARTYLGEIAAAAQLAGVTFESVDVEEGSPADAILEVARGRNCDLIVMASHGRRGLSRVLLGSETSKVLAHATQPVLVTR